MHRIFDAHCDTVFELEAQGKSLCGNDLHLDVERMCKYDTYIQVFAAFVDKTDIKVSPMNHCLKLMDRYHTEIENSGGLIKTIETAAELEAAESGGVHSILSIEGGEALEGNLSALRMYYKMGVRLITLTWNHANELADGITESRGGGLTEFGRKAVVLMEKMGILIDVSHLSERGFWDVAECTKHPFVASHSCVKTLSRHIRNLSDEQLDTIIARRGCVGVNFYPEFLADNGRCDVNEIIRHIEYILARGGKASVGLGSDFDGVESLPSGMSGVQDMTKIEILMDERGFSDELKEAVMFGNFYRVFRETLLRGEKSC